MQLPAGPDTHDTGLPHTRARLTHWLTTAVALAAVTGAAALVEPTGATAHQGAAERRGTADAGGTPADHAPRGGPDPAAVTYPVDCGPLGVLVTEHAEFDLEADGVAETIAVVRCDAGSGSPPHGMYLVAHGQDGDAAPRVTETLLDPAERMTVDRLDTTAGTISARLLGYSSADVPRCCPDLLTDIRWEWRDGRLEPHVTPQADSV